MSKEHALYNMHAMGMGDALMYLRLGAGLLQKNVAYMVKVNDRTYRAWENGKRFPPINNLLCLCSYYKVSLAELFALANRYMV